MASGLASPWGIKSAYSYSIRSLSLSSNIPAVGCDAMLVPYGTVC